MEIRDGAHHKPHPKKYSCAQTETSQIATSERNFDMTCDNNNYDNSSCNHLLIQSRRRSYHVKSSSRSYNEENTRERERKMTSGYIGWYT
mmetsp:Transcript_30501/g.43257  ORF Transcript_30501/g.43257 Transcript_30501/m.43257 type:complete len:90 (-) Transcript_30501:293-562(-)